MLSIVSVTSKSLDSGVIITRTCTKKPWQILPFLASMVTLSDVRTPANSGPFPLKHGGEGKVQGQQPKASSAPGGAGREGGQWEEGIVLRITALPTLSPPGRRVSERPLQKD